jgi:hypothetical protein
MSKTERNMTDYQKVTVEEAKADIERLITEIELLEELIDEFEGEDR